MGIDELIGGIALAAFTKALPPIGDAVHKALVSPRAHNELRLPF